MVDQAEPKYVPLVDLRPMLPHLRAGARALRSRAQWATTAHAPTDAEHAADDARVLERFAHWLDRACPEEAGDAQ